MTTEKKFEGPLNAYRQELLIEVVDEELINKGASNRYDKAARFDSDVKSLPVEIRSLVEQSYLLGFKDGVVRCVYGDSYFASITSFARRIRSQLEIRFEQHRATQETRGSVRI